MSLCQSFRPVTHFFPRQSTFFSLFYYYMEKGCGHIDVLKTIPGDTNRKYIYMGLWSNFNCSSMNPTIDRQTDRQTDRLFILYSIDIHVDLLQHMICSHIYLSN